MLQCLDPKIQVLNLFVDGKVVKIPNKNRNFSERMNLKKGRNAIVINSEPPSNVKIQSIEVTPSE